MAKDPKKAPEAPKAEVEAEAPVADNVKQMIADAVSAALKEAIPLATAVALQATQQNGALAAKGLAVPAALAPLDPNAEVIGPGRCTECGQLRKACFGKHRKTVIFPKDEDMEEIFPGIRINSVTYRSNHAQHLITVPENSAYEAEVTKWEKMEKELARGRKKVHNSGTLDSPTRDHWTEGR